jgi:peptidyl-prolyl cis-trans isomerase B (cyclophilin B)
MVILHTNFGAITLKLASEQTPNTVENFLNYVRQGFYSGTIFHRLINGFVVQGGGFEPGLTPKQTAAAIENEANLGLKNRKGTVAMARTNDPHSASSQFFINLNDNHFLDHKSKTPEGWGYCAFAEVTEGLDVVEKIAEVKTQDFKGHQDVPQQDVILERVEMIEA